MKTKNAFSIYPLLVRSTIFIFILILFSWTTRELLRIFEIASLLNKFLVFFYQSVLSFTFGLLLIMVGFYSLRTWNKYGILNMSQPLLTLRYFFIFSIQTSLFSILATLGATLMMPFFDMLLIYVHRIFL